MVGAGEVAVAVATAVTAAEVGAMEEIVEAVAAPMPASTSRREGAPVAPHAASIMRVVVVVVVTAEVAVAMEETAEVVEAATEETVINLITVCSILNFIRNSCMRANQQS